MGKSIIENRRREIVKRASQTTTGIKKILSALERPAKRKYEYGTKKEFNIWIKQMSKQLEEWSEGKISYKEHIKSLVQKIKS